MPLAPTSSAPPLVDTPRSPDIAAADKHVDVIDRLVAAAPPLTSGQRERLAVILGGGGR